MSAPIFISTRPNVRFRIDLEHLKMSAFAADGQARPDLNP